MLQGSAKSKRAGSAKGRKRRVGLSGYQEDRLKQELRTATPSEPWVEAQFKTVGDVDQAGTPIVYRYHNPHAFPPGGVGTGMVRCPECGVFNPPQTFEQGRCLDHAEHGGWGPSPSALAIAALQMYNLRLEDLADLAPEDSESLRREIQDLQKTRPRSKRGKTA